MDYGEILSNFLMQVVFPIGGTVVLALVGYAANKLGRKLGIEQAAAFEAWAIKVARDAVAAAEEWGAAQVKDAKKITGAEKFDYAAGWLMRRLPQVKRDEVEGWINAALGSSFGAGATKNKPIGS